jgi:hypothetical protein
VKSQNKEKISGGDINRLFCKRQPKGKRSREKQGRFTNFGQGVKQNLLKRWLPFLKVL